MSELQFGADAPLLHVMSTMRAMRRLKPDPVPRELIEQLITAASYAPSGGNNQTFSFVVVTDREPIAQLAPTWRRIVEWYTTTQTPPAHMEQDAWQRLMGVLQHQAEHFEEIPVLIVACYEMRSAAARMLRTLDKQRAGLGVLGARRSLSALRNTPRMLATAETASIYPAVQNLLLMARALGLAATLTTWHVMFENEFKSVLGIPGSVNTYAIIPVGWPAGRFGPVSRRSASESIHWQKW
ncbi:MAG TPA: nitroreductase family protein [Jatrophihabitantaceae bacterium]|nr:nitroreductase family protein [Jatrophihabitantaceae bacterium]